MKQNGSSMNQGKIVPIEESTVQRIVAGQAITDLASAVKELVDNSLDAGAKTINIRLFNQGLDIVEVSDDGYGVPIESRPHVAMKHATSKIREFDDIYSIDSLGFRGEALFCLSNLSRNLVVATRTSNELMGQKLEYTRDGLLRPDSCCPVPRKVGTTVAVVKIFEAVPVRRADLEKRINVQRREVFLMVQGYAIQCLGVKFNLFDISNSGREEVRLSTMQGATKLEENISSVLGSSFLSGMCRISIDLPIQSPPGEWRVVGLISKAPHLSARDGSLARNAQFFSINGRPVDLPKISRALSDAWRKIDTTSKKKPACILLFSLPKTAYDVNLAPNKRQVLLIDESNICTSIIEGALALWNSQRDGIFLSHEVDLCKGKVESPDFSKETPNGRKVMRRLGFYNDFRHVKLQHDLETTQLQGTSNVNQIHVREENSSDTHKDQFNIVSVTAGSTQDEKNEPHRTDSKYDDCTDADKRLFIKVQDQFRKQNDGDINDPLICSDHATPTCEIDYPKTDGNQEMKETKSLDSSIHRRSQISSDKVECQGKRPECQTLLKSIDSSSKTLIGSTYPSPPSNVDRKKASIMEHFPPSRTTRTTASEQIDQDTEIIEGSQVNGDEAVHSICAKDAIEWTSFNGTDFVVESSRKSRLELSDNHKRLKRLRSDIPNIDRTLEVENFGMELDEPVECDKTSKVSLSKKDFEQMEVIGQFNLGFILAKCHSNNLWVLDQHACDEKYNFELLCEKTVLQEQKLLAPMPLELTPSEENCILENLKVFEQSGFRFSHSDDNSGQRQLFLISLPHSGARDGRKAVQFGKDDVRALCAILGADGNGFAPQDGGTGVDGSGSYGNNAVRRYAGLSQKGENAMSRLPKAVAMFANRACRGSVMIGTALSKKEMETIVHRLANVEHPWNCPHGRPTLKHVTDLMKVECSDLRGTLVYNVGPTMATESEITQPDID